MRTFLTTLFLILSVGFSGFQPAKSQPEKLQVLVTVGGVGYHNEFVRILRRHPNIEITIRDFDTDPRIFTPESLEGIDAILMYHRDNVADEEERAALEQFLENGGGIVVWHHSLANYPDWETWWREHVGGLYVLSSHKTLPPSQYFLDFQGAAFAVGQHPITEGLGGVLRYRDEGYSNLWVSPEAKVLMRTSAFGSDPAIAWVGPSSSERVVYIQPGHSREFMVHPKFMTLLENALNWVAR